MKSPVEYHHDELCLFRGAENLGLNSHPRRWSRKHTRPFSKGDMEGWSALHSDELTFTILGDLPQSGVPRVRSYDDKVFEVLPVHWPSFN